MYPNRKQKLIKSCFFLKYKQYKYILQIVRKPCLSDKGIQTLQLRRGNMKGVAILLIGLLVSSAGTSGVGESSIFALTEAKFYFDHK